MKKLTAIPKRRRPASVRPTSTKSSQPGGPPPDLSKLLTSQIVPIEEVEFLAGNPLDHPTKQIEQLKAALERWGQVENLVINRRTNPHSVVGGNGRLRAMLALGWTHVSVCYVDLGESDAHALAIVLNKIREGAKWKDPELKAMLGTIKLPDLDVRLAPLLKTKLPRLNVELSEPGAPTKTKCPECGHEFEA